MYLVYSEIGHVAVLLNPVLLLPLYSVSFFLLFWVFFPVHFLLVLFIINLESPFFFFILFWNLPNRSLMFSWKFTKFSCLQFSCSVLFCFLPSPFKFLVECSETEQMSLKMLVNTLQAFIEGSTLGEFRARLQALLVFHCHVLLMPQVAEKGKHW